MADTLVAAAAIDAAAGAAFAAVAWRLARRPVSAGAARAARMFALWWAALGGYTLVQAALNLAGWAGFTPLEPFVASRIATLALACAAFAGLMHYLVYLYTGRDVLRRAAVAYGALFALSAGLALASRPVAVDVQAWRTDLVYAGGISPAILVAFLVVFIGPPMGCALAYLRIGRRLRDPERRWRVNLVGPAMVVWLAATFLSRAAQDGWLQLWMRPVLGLAVAGVVLVAFAPPRWMRARWARAALQGEGLVAPATPPPDAGPPEDERRQPALPRGRP